MTFRDPNAAGVTGQAWPMPQTGWVTPDGKVLYEDGEYKTIDIEKTIAGVERSAKRISRELAKNEIVIK